MTMEKKLQDYLDEAFAPYGNFPGKTDVKKELLANLVERYNDYKKQGMNDAEAYQMTVDSFGDVEEIMEEVPHSRQTDDDEETKTSLRDSIKNIVTRSRE